MVLLANKKKYTLFSKIRVEGKQGEKKGGGNFSSWFLKGLKGGGGGNGLQRQMQVQTPKLEDLGLIEILKWCMVSDCLFRTNR